MRGWESEEFTARKKREKEFEGGWKLAVKLPSWPVAEDSSPVLRGRVMDVCFHIQQLKDQHVPFWAGVWSQSYRLGEGEGLFGALYSMIPSEGGSIRWGHFSQSQLGRCKIPLCNLWILKIIFLVGVGSQKKIIFWQYFISKWKQERHIKG